MSRSTAAQPVPSGSATPSLRDTARSGVRDAAEAEAAPVLEVRNLEVVYNDVALVLSGVSLTVRRGEVVALLGPNGAGKTTLLRAISGLLPVHRGEITKGSVLLDGDRVDGKTAPALVRRGLGQVMEARRLFPELTVEENLIAGSSGARGRAARREAFDRVMHLFPTLAEYRRTTAGYLSGGQQQMVAIGRALMSSPRVLLLDEPSLGLAPQAVQQVREVIAQIRDGGTSVLLVEQNAAMALSVGQRGYVVEHGRVVLDGSAERLAGDADIQESYLGVGTGGRKSYRDVKSYRRKKRWSA